MKKSFKKFLPEYFKYVKFGDTVQDEDDTEVEDDPTENANRRKELVNRNKYDKAKKGDGKQDYHPQTFRHWMEISIAGDD